MQILFYRRKSFKFSNIFIYSLTRIICKSIHKSIIETYYEFSPCIFCLSCWRFPFNPKSSSVKLNFLPIKFHFSAKSTEIFYFSLMQTRYTWQGNCDQSWIKKLYNLSVWKFIKFFKPKLYWPCSDSQYICAISVTKTINNQK